MTSQSHENVVALRRDSAQTTESKISIILNLSRPRTWVFAVSAFLFGYMSLGLWNPALLILGSLSFAGLTGATNLINAYTDRIEDAVNSPKRTTWIRALGINGLKYTIICFYGISIALAVPLGVFYVAIFAVGVFDSLFYSLKPLRFKRHIASALPSFAGALAIPFLAGSSIYGKINLLNPMLIILTLFMIGYGTIKNGPDYFGDRVAGLRTSATIFTDRKSEALFNLGLLLTPHVATFVYAIAGLISPIYFLVLPFALVPAYVVLGPMETYDNQRLEKFHTYGNFYGIGFVLLLFYLTIQSMLAAELAGVLYAYALVVHYLKKDSRIVAFQGREKKV
jgi:4-hydroxybenzoate polyprenyltransferase